MDVGAYFARIGYAGPRSPTRAVLEDIVLRHVQSVPFENLDAFSGRRVSLDPTAVEHKLVHSRRGGWCFEQNLLLGEALRALGFEVTDLAGRVLWGRAPDAITPRTHRLLRVRLRADDGGISRDRDGDVAGDPADVGDWLVDAGFGGHTLTGVLDLHDEASQDTPHEPFRLRRLNDTDRVLESLIAGEWRALCRFDLQPQLPIDFEAANYQLAHDPASHFTQGLVVSRVSDDGRHVMRGLELGFHGLDGTTSRAALDKPEEVLAALREVFGIDADALPELRQRLEQAQAGSAARS
jgi:N-hydroxyarylamine O-acetyltransferase